MLSYPHTFIFIGRSGSGKGTQAELLKDFLVEQDTREVEYIQTGQRFRDFAETDSYTAGLTRKLMSEGGLMPEFLSVWNWSSILVEEMKGDQHLIVDGMPRRSREAEILDTAMDFYKRSMPLVIYIELSEESARKRLLLRGRADDVETDIQKRLEWFETDVAPVIENYKNNKKYNVLSVDGEGKVEEIQKNIQEKFKEIYGYND